MTEEVEVVVESEEEVAPEAKSATISQEPEPEPVLEVVAEPAPVVKSRPKSNDLVGAVVSTSALVYRPSKRNSASVAVVQDRLVARGFGAARGDLRGWYHDGTRKAVAAFQKAEGLPETGECDRETLDALLAGTAAEVVA